MEKLMANKVRYSEEELKLRRKEAQQHYHELNPGLAAQWRRQYTKDHPEKRLLWAAKKRAKEHNLPFNLEENDIIIPLYCPYLGIKLSTTSQRGDSRENVCSLDKIVPNLGYVKGNVEVISHLANTMKSNATKEQLLKFANEIQRRYS